MTIYDNFVRNYLEWGEESPTSFSINHKNINNIEELKKLNNIVLDLSSQHHDFKMHFAYQIEHKESGFELELNIYSKERVIIHSFEIESEIELENIFANEQLILELQKCREAHENSKPMHLDEIEKIIEEYINYSETNSVSISFSFEKNIIVSKFSEPSLEEYNIIIFLSFPNFEKYMGELSFKDLKKTLLNDKLNTLILIEGLNSNCFGNYFATFDLEEAIENKSLIEDYVKSSKKDIVSYRDKLGKLIAGINDDFFIPPQYFDFLKSDSCIDNLKALFYPALLFNLYISFSDSMEFTESSCKLRINSKRTVYSEFTFDNRKYLKYNINGNTIKFNDYITQIEELYHFYLKTFGLMNTEEIDETKVLIAKKVISIYSRTYIDILTHIKDIINSASSEYNLYIRERVDDFIAFKEQLINYRFNQNKEIIKFNSNLSETLSSTFFKIIGFILVFIIGLIAKVDETLIDEYMLIVPFLLGLFILFSIYRLHTIKVLYYESQKHQSKYESYFNRYLNAGDIEDLGETINDCIFNREYYVNLGVLLILLAACAIFWTYANWNVIENNVFPITSSIKMQIINSTLNK
ncbi:hypothetical protein V7O61_12495 [Methanolobus sp. WCC1]|uniref:hypothetical protein n=1 Tax=unclassified Methanolobus TaxID=2629569 RepID=UPI00324E2A03